MDRGHLWRELVTKMRADMVFIHDGAIRGWATFVEGEGVGHALSGRRRRALPILLLGGWGSSGGNGWMVLDEWSDWVCT